MTDALSTPALECPHCSSPLEIHRDGDPGIDTPMVCRAPGIRQLRCTHPRCNYRLHFSTVVDERDPAAMADMRRSLARSASLHRSRPLRPAGPDIPEQMLTTADLNGFSIISLNQSDLRSISTSLAKLCARTVTNKDAIPHLSVRPQFMRPDKTSELWCLPQLSWFGTADLTQVEAATSALNEAIASNTLLCGKVTPEQFHQRRRGLDGQTP